MAPWWTARCQRKSEKRTAGTATTAGARPTRARRHIGHRPAAVASNPRGDPPAPKTNPRFALGRVAAHTHSPKHQGNVIAPARAMGTADTCMRYASQQVSRRAVPGLAPRFSLGWKCNLPPVSFLHLPVIAMVDPPGSNPTLVFLGRTLPAAGGPDVVVALPAVVAGDPHVTPIRWPAAVFVHGPRWTYADHNLRKRGRREQCES